MLHFLLLYPIRKAGMKGGQTASVRSSAGKSKIRWSKTCAVPLLLAYYKAYAKAPLIFQRPIHQLLQPQAARAQNCRCKAGIQERAECFQG